MYVHFFMFAMTFFLMRSAIPFWNVHIILKSLLWFVSNDNFDLLVIWGVSKLCVLFVCVFMVVCFKCIVWLYIIGRWRMPSQTPGVTPTIALCAGAEIHFLASCLEFEFDHMKIWKDIYVRMWVCFYKSIWWIYIHKSFIHFMKCVIYFSLVLVGLV